MMPYVEVEIEVLGFHFLCQSPPPGWLQAGRGVLLPDAPSRMMVRINGGERIAALALTEEEDDAR